jgi:hypothetical protein
MAKSSRSRVIKENNRRLKKNVFGPVEAARAERLSAKLLALAAEPKPQRDVEMNEGTSELTNSANLHANEFSQSQWMRPRRPLRRRTVSLGS